MATKTDWVTPVEFLRQNPSIGRNTLYDRLRDGSIPHVRIGPRKIFIRSDVFEQMASQQGQNGESAE